MTTKSPTDLARDARTLADSLRERFNAGEFTLHRAATMLDTLAALISEQAATIAALKAPKVKPQAPRPFKVGDEVRVTRKIEIDSKGNDCFWNPAKSALLGDTAEITGPVTTGVTLGIAGDYWWFSVEALDLVRAVDEA